MIPEAAVEAAAMGIMGVNSYGWAWYAEPVREQARAEARRALEAAAQHINAQVGGGTVTPANAARARHDWELLGGGGGWELWRCQRCKRKAVPIIFGQFWPFPRCRA